MSTAPRPSGLFREARLSSSAIDSNLSLVLELIGPSDAVIDVRADAYGHGLALVTGRALAYGITRFRVSGGQALPAGAHAATKPGDPTIETAVYGLVPELRGRRLSPVLSVVGEVIAVRNVPPQSPVSYGYTYRTAGFSTLALVGLGYADGIPRLGSSRAEALVNGARAGIAGRIAMDQFVLDLGGLSASVGDEVTPWGDERTGAPSAQEWAAATDRTAANLTTGLGTRVRRVVVP